MVELRIKKKGRKTTRKKSNLILAIISLILISAITLIIVNINKIIPAGDVEQQMAVAMVNGEAITREELDNYYNFYFFVNGLPSFAKQFITKESLLNQTLIPEKILLQKASEEGVAVSYEEVNGELDKIFGQLSLSKSEFESRLTQNNISMDYLRKYIKTQQTILKLLEQEVLYNITVTDEEVEDYYNENIELFSAKEGEIRVRHILVNSSSEARDILNKLNNGADFEELAKKYSIDSSAVIGGDIGFIAEGYVDREFWEAASKLKEGEISDIVKTRYGYHIIKREPGRLELDEIKEKLKEELLREKQGRAIRNYVNKLRRNSDVTILPESISSVAFGLSPPQSKIKTFRKTSDSICEENGKPIIRMFSTTWCPHCGWIKETFDETMEKYVAEGKIVAYHWQLDTGDDTLTGEAEANVPESELAIFKKYSPRLGVPTFVFGCQYVRIGNAYELEGNLRAEKEEFEAVIEELVKHVRSGSLEKAVENKTCSEYSVRGDVIFYTAEWCSSCKSIMEQIVNLKREGYSFSVIDRDSVDTVKNCFDIDTNKAPQIICSVDGEMFSNKLITKNSLRRFAEDCRKKLK